MRSQVRPAFTLIDLLVAVSVIAVLIGILVPSLGPVHESARRVVCQSNLRQIGTGIMMYADDWKGELPASKFLQVNGSRDVAQPQSMLTLRTFSDRADGTTVWDGIGLLASCDYLTAPKVFYCPSHRGENHYSRYAPVWNEGNEEIVGNYHFRGEGPIGFGGHQTTRSLYRIDPAQSSLIADGMRIQSDYNHRVGVNFFRADLTVHWFSDHDGHFSALLPPTKALADMRRTYVDDAWNQFDLSAGNGNGPY